MMLPIPFRFSTALSSLLLLSCNDTPIGLTPSPRIANQIVFVADSPENANSALYVMRPDGTGRKRLTTNTGLESSPRVSRDGRLIAFVRFASGSFSEIFVVNADGSNERQVTFDPTTKKGPLTWSPDGRSIVFSAEDLNTNASDLYLLDLSNGQVHAITATIDNPTRRAYGTPDWSPVSNEIVFSKNGEFYWITPAGSVVRKRTYGGLSHSPRYSPDGTQIVFTVMDPSTNDIDIGIINSDGNNFAIAVSGPSRDVQPDWSPDAASLVFASNTSGDYEIYTVPTHGGQRRNVSNRHGIDFHPSWR